MPYLGPRRALLRNPDPPVVLEAEAAVATFRSNTSSTSDLATYTFNTQACGPAVAGRRIVVGVFARAPLTTLDMAAVSPVTVNGNDAAVVQKGRNTDTNISIAALYEIVEATGTTCNVVVNLNSNASRCAIVVYDVTGAGGASSVGNVSVAADPTATLSVVANSATIGVAMCGGLTTATPGNLSDDLDTQIESSMTVTAGSSNTASGSTAFTFDFASPLANTSAGAFASWGP